MKIQSPRSKALTSDAPMCSACNNSRSQPYDRAWERLHGYLRDHWDEVARQRRFNLGRVFPGGTLRESINVQLFFAKLMGCRAQDAKATIDYASLADSFLKRKATPLIFLRFGEAVGQTALNSAGCTDIEAIEDKAMGRAVRLLWTYYVGKIQVRIGYADPVLELGYGRTRGNPAWER